MKGSAMRLEALRKGMRVVEMPLTQREVIYCLNDTADYKTGVCRKVTVRELAEAADANKETVTIALAGAENWGFIKVVGKRVKNRTPQYMITPPDKDRLAELERLVSGSSVHGEEGAERPVSGSVSGSKASNPDTVSGPEVEGSRSAQASRGSHGETEGFTETTEAQVLPTHTVSAEEDTLERSGGASASGDSASVRESEPPPGEKKPNNDGIEGEEPRPSMEDFERWNDDAGFRP